MPPPDPGRFTLPDAAQAAAVAETGLRELHPDAMSRFDELRTTQAPDVALAEVAPLIDPASTTSGRDGLLAAAAAAAGEAPQVRYAPVVRDVLNAQVAMDVLRDDAWPALASALQHAEQLGAQPADLLRQVAGQRELDSAKNIAEVLHHRIEHRRVEQRTPTAADIAASSYPTPLAAPARTTPVDPFATAEKEHVQQDNPRLATTDPAALGAAVELGRVADAEWQAAQVNAATPDGALTPRVDERHEGLNQAAVHTNDAAADQSTATALLTQAGARPTRAASEASAPATAGQSYPTPIKEVSAAQAAPKPATPASAARTAVQATAPRTGRRR